MRIVFMGTGEIALPSLSWLLEKERNTQVVAVFTQPDKKIGRHQTLTPPAAKTLAREAGIPVLQPESLRKEPASIDALRDLAPDLLVVMAYGQILPRAVIETPRIACVNLHASLLPRHRGASPIQAAIREGDEETGITLMHVAPKLDSGDMILKKAIPISPSDTGGTLHDRLADLGPQVLAEGLPLLASGSAPREPQDDSVTTYAGKLERTDGRLDWSRPATEIERIIRAYDPWPGTHFLLPESAGGKTVKVFPATEIEEGDSETPGTLLSTEEALLVACGSGALRLSGELQLEGKKRLPAADFLRGFPLVPGSILR